MDSNALDFVPVCMFVYVYVCRDSERILEASIPSVQQQIDRWLQNSEEGLIYQQAACGSSVL